MKFTQVPNLIIDSVVLSVTSAFPPGNYGVSFNVDLHNDQANMFDDNLNSVTSEADIPASFYDSFRPKTGALSTTTFAAI